ncbi:MAG: alpha/beta hydrolase family protein [Actinomycetota bacterium]
MIERDLVVDTGDIRLPATLTAPEHVRAGIVTMHPANSASRDSFLLANVAEILLPRGFAVLRYDRRPADGIDDVPFAAQAADARRAIAILRDDVGDVPIGLWAYSQGTWGATLAAADAPDEVAFLALVAAPGVSPAEQMRYGTAEQLRRNGYEDDALAELAEVRIAIERYLRGASDRDTAQAVIARYADRPWFALTHYPTDLPSDATWHDMDFDPAPQIARVRCPVLLVYGSRDEWTPVEPSLAVWRGTSKAALTVEVLEGRGHAPVIDGSETPGSVDPRYVASLRSWLDGIVR